jgi:hypothetical protein
MPWRKNTPHCFFNQELIRSNAPADSGVYGLYDVMEWVCIGEAANIREALLEHRRGMDPCVRSLSPTGFTFELCSAELRVERAAELISELQPLCNRLKLRKVESA